MKLIQIFLLMFFGLVLAQQVVARSCDVDSGFRGTVFSFDRYANRDLVKPIGKLEDLPTDVRGKLYAHLTAKLGKTFLKRLKYDGGEWLDLVALRKRAGDSWKADSSVGAYDLLFHFSDRSRGLKHFYTKISLSDDGSVARDIGLPNINFDPSKAVIISCENAISIAEEKGFPKTVQRVNFDYSPTDDAFVWVISDSRPVESDTTDNNVLDLVQIGQRSYRKIEINANTGKVLRVYKKTIIF